MSRRFGRNQRRRAREAIATLQDITNDQLSALTANRAKLRELEQELDHAKELVGPMSILFPAEEEMSVGWKSTDRAQACVDVSPPLPDLAPSFAQHETEPMCFRTIPLDVLILRVERSELDQCLHVGVKFADGVWGYGITRKAWAAMTYAQRVKLIRQTLPDTLADAVAKHGLGRGY